MGENFVLPGLVFVRNCISIYWKNSWNVAVPMPMLLGGAKTQLIKSASECQEPTDITHRKENFSPAYEVSMPYLATSNFKI